MPTILKRTSRRLALEVIDFQEDNFGIELESLISDIYSKYSDKIYKKSTDVLDGPEIKQLQNKIFKRLGIKVKFVVDKVMAATIPFYSNTNHVFLDDSLRGIDVGIDASQIKILSKANNKVGYVNIAKATVGGIFSQYEHALYMNFKLLRMQKLTPAETAAVLLHELGHDFYACEYSNRLSTCNRVLEDVAEKLLSKDKDKDLVYIYRELKTVNTNITEEEVEKLVSGERIIPGIIWFKTIIGTVESQLANNKYDNTSFEQLADNFPSRFGYGRELISGLEKLMGLYNRLSNIFIVIESLKDLRLTLVLFNTLVSTIGIPVILSSVLAPAIIIFLIFISGEDFNDYTYDELRTRYKRIRNDQVELLKTMNIPDDQLKGILIDIQYMDDLINKTSNYKSLFNILANYIIPVHKKTNKAIVEQQLLEKLTANDLFIAAAKLKTI